MATTAEYLNQLQKDKETLVNNLVEKGVDASNEETFTSLAPKVADISSGDLSEFISSEFSDTGTGIGATLVKKIPDITYTGTSTGIIRLYGFFQNLSGLEKMPKLDLGNAKTSTLQAFFNGCRSLVDISNLKQLDTSEATSCYNMFNGCTNLKEIPTFDTSKVTSFGNFIYEGTSSSGFKLERVEELNLESATSISSMFFSGRSPDFSNLTYIGGFINLGKAYTQKTTNYSSYTLNLSIIKSIPYESLMNIINGLYDLNLTYDVANGGTLYTQKLILRSTDIEKLSDDDIAIATAKGWTITTS